jgi:hypothetical protein
MNLQKLLAVLIVINLSACGTTEVIKKPDSTFTVSAQYGSVNGSWNRASAEAAAKASQYCETLGQKYIFLSEKRDGVLGFTPQVSEITFQCGQDTNTLLLNDRGVCEKEMQTEELNLISTKVELIRDNESPVPFQIASNQDFPTDQEKPAIAKWAKIREDCVRRSVGIISNAKLNGTQLQQTQAQQDLAYSKNLSASVAELIVALYQQKLTYGEFAQKRFEISRSITAAQREFRASILIADRDAQSKAQLVAEQQMQNNMMAWSTYMQTVNARQPLRVNCTQQKFGNTITTHCY